MSFDAIRWALSQDTGKSSTKFVLVAMAEHVNAESQDWTCWASYARLASITLQDVKTVEAAVYRLKELGFIVDTGQRNGGTNKVVVYRLNDPKNGGLTPGLQPESANGTRPQNDPKSGVIQGETYPPKFPGNPPKFPKISPQISEEMTPKTGDGIRNGTRKTGRDAASAAPTIPGVSPDLVADWLAVRKAKRGGPLTKTAIAGLLREAEKAGLTPTEAITFCCEASWVGFNSGWYFDRVSKGGAAPKTEGTFV